MRRIAILLVGLISVAGCTPAEHAAWADWFAKDPVTAKAELAKIDLAIPAKAPMGSKCPGWYEEAMEAGFQFNQWRTVDRIMWRESKCQQGVRNRSGATGLMQVMPMWADDCGTTVSGLQNGYINLRCAVHILHTQGWGAWA